MTQFTVFGDQMQEHNTEECNDRIRVCPCVLLHCGHYQHERDTTQRGTLRPIVNQTLDLLTKILDEMLIGSIIMLQLANV